jgi:hypothetical protein
MEESKKQGLRSTLKLKSPIARTSVAPVKAAARKPEAASWADEHKRRMQADMDALGFANAVPGGRERRG